MSASVRSWVSRNVASALLTNGCVWSWGSLGTDLGADKENQLYCLSSILRCLGTSFTEMKVVLPRLHLIISNMRDRLSAQCDFRHFMQTTPYTRTAINCSSRCRAMEPPDLGPDRALICALGPIIPFPLVAARLTCRPSLQRPRRRTCGVHGVSLSSLTDYPSPSNPHP